MFEKNSGPGRVAQSVGHLTRKSGVLGSIPGLATYFRFSFRFFKQGSCQLLAKVCARSTGERVTLISEMDLFLRNGRNGDFFTKWSYKIII